MLKTVWRDCQTVPYPPLKGYVKIDPIDILGVNDFSNPAVSV